jgi:hypothetical protein
LFALIALDRYGTHYSIARDRIQARNGIISKNERSVRLENIRDLWLDQGVIQRLLGVGSIGFSTGGPRRVRSCVQGHPEAPRAEGTDRGSPVSEGVCVASRIRQRHSPDDIPCRKPAPWKRALDSCTAARNQSLTSIHLHFVDPTGADKSRPIASSAVSVSDMRGRSSRPNSARRSSVWRPASGRRRARITPALSLTH